MAETVLFQEQDVVVTPTRVCVGATTYALRHITSVRLYEEVDPRLWLLSAAKYFSWVCWVGLALGFLAMLDSPPRSPVAGFLVLCLLGAANYWYPKALDKIGNKTQWPRYRCLLATSGQEQQVLASEDREFIQRVIHAINQAIVGAAP